MNWLPFLPATEIAPGSMQARQGILVVHTAQDEWYAVDNACPHQGYPLAQGSIQGCALTCTWHNFKFDVRDGACLMGEESLRTHAIRINEGIIEVSRNETVDLAPRWSSLREGVARHQNARVAREVARLIVGGVSARQLLIFAAVWDANRGEFGPGHCGALAADLADLARLPSNDPLEHQVRVVVDALDLAAENTRGLPERDRPAPVEPPTDANAQLRALVEAEDARGAEALVRGMVRANWSRVQIESAFYPLVADHFLDFGHALLYLPRHLDLLEGATQDDVDAVLGGLVFRIVNGTREDLLPPWAGFRKRWTGFVESAGPARALAAKNERDPAERALPADESALRLAILDGSPGACFEAVSSALLEGRWAEVLNGLNAAGAERLLRFNPEHAANVMVTEGWLDVTHRLTVPHAARRAVQAWNNEGCTRILLMVAHFVNLGRPLDRAVDEAALSSSVSPQPDLMALALAPRATRPIFNAHDIKTAFAAQAEATLMGNDLAIRAAAHYLTSPLYERTTPRFAHEAVRLVRDGKPPRGLTG